MKLDKKMMTEINKSIDTFVQKNKITTNTTKQVDQLEKRVRDLEKTVQNLTKQLEKSSGGSSNSAAKAEKRDGEISKFIGKHDIRLTRLEQHRLNMGKAISEQSKYVGQHDARLTRLEQHRLNMGKELRKLIDRK